MVDNPTESSVAVGDVLAGKYRVERVLGSGGMGVVVAAVHLDLGELRAIKLLLPERSASAETVERFMREARAVARLRNAHVAKVLDVGRLDAGEPYIVMEHLVGRDLKDELVARGAALGVEEVASHIMQALEGVAEAHAAGIIHRDLKPANLFLTEDADGLPSIKLLDFGISKVSADLASGSNEMTQTASLLGTPLYMSPEQMRSAKNVDRRSDIWSLGVILYKLLTCRTPFKGDSITSVCLDVVEREPVAPSKLNPRIPPGVEAILRRCLEKEPDRRYQNAFELATALAPFAGPEAQTSLYRIDRWHHSPPPAVASNPSFSGMAERASAPGLAERASSPGLAGAFPAARGSGPGADPGILGETNTEASWGRTGSSTLASTRSRPLWAIAGVGIGVVAVGLTVVLALGDSTSPAVDTNEGGPADRPAGEAATASEASPAEASPSGEAVDAASTGAESPATDSSATVADEAGADAGIEPDDKPARPVARPVSPRPTKPKPVEPKPDKPKPDSRDNDPFGTGRW